jgi:hypothetical protein
MIKRFNDWLGDKLAFFLSSMVCFYIVSITILSTLFFQKPNGLQAWLIFWITVFFQGVALPVLGYVGRKAGEKQERLLKETHDVVKEELALIKKMINKINKNTNHSNDIPRSQEET